MKEKQTESGTVEERPKKKKKTMPIIIAVIAVIIIWSVANGGNKNSSTPSGGTTSDAAGSTETETSTTTTTATAEGTTGATEPAVSEPTTVAVNTNFTSGNYTAGIDFPAGTYNITAVSGSGNVSSSNMYTGGINAMMGTDAANKEAGSDLYEQQYSNISLDDGVILTVSGGVTVNIACDAASGDALQTRNQSITKTVSLGNGNFTAGTDFEAGTYNIAAVSGTGNISSSNLYDGGVNAMMGIDDGTGLYEKEYKNIDLPEGTTLTIDGVKIQLVPST